MKNSFKKISMSVIAGTIILGSVANVSAAPSKYKTTNTKSLYTYKYKSNKPTTKPSAPTNNNTTTAPNNQDIKPEETVVDENKTTNISSVESEVLKLVNIERQKQGLSPLKLSSELSKVAKIKSQDMADKNYFSHNSPTYGSPFDMMKQFGIKYTTAGENIAKGYSSAQAVMNGWMNSPGHKANILSSNFGTLGVGYVEKNGSTYWTQMFTN